MNISAVNWPLVFKKKTQTKYMLTLSCGNLCFLNDLSDCIMYCCAACGLMRHRVVCNRYSPNELRYLPLNTALFEPPLDPELPALDSEPDSDEGEDCKDDKKNKNLSVRF